jgi:hypothetical protein
MEGAKGIGRWLAKRIRMEEEEEHRAKRTRVEPNWVGLPEDPLEVITSRLDMLYSLELAEA